MTLINMQVPENSFLAYLGWTVLRRQAISAEVIEGLDHEDIVDLFHRIANSAADAIPHEGKRQGGVFPRPDRPGAPYELIIMTRTEPRDLSDYLTDMPRRIEA